jgi:sigma-B regulation protein RsbU (phosphoserine phosphatase)
VADAGETAERANFTARILVVDDNEDNRYTLILRLELEGYQDITVATDGEEALELLRGQEFDLVLLDVMMPKLDGYGVLEQLKQEGRLHNLPVIMVSALNELDSVVRCIEAGAVDYLVKPFNPVLLSARIGASLEKKRLRDEVRTHLARIEQELDAARELQMGMVPTFFPPPTPERPVEIFAMMEPAREVGGDLYDFFDGPDGSLCFLLGDVSGKGVPAALFMAGTKNLVRLVTDLLRGPDGDLLGPGEILGRVNRELCQDNVGMMFVTLFLGILQPRTGELRFCNAGHGPPYRIRGQSVDPLVAAAGPPLGIRPRAVYGTETIRLKPGDALYLYSDGITEAADASGALFSEDRLATVLCNASGRAEDFVPAVADAVTEFVGDTPRSDDITAMAIRLLES